MQRHDTSELATIAKLPAIAFATAALEHVLPVAEGATDADQVLRAMIDELWAWQLALPAAGARALTQKEARELPSGRFYFVYQARLLELVSEYKRGQPVRDLLGAAIALISFGVWLIDEYERSLYPDKPLVLGNDISEVGWETLAIGLETLVRASPDPAATLAWQHRHVRRLVAEHPASADPSSFGSRLGRSYFFAE